MSKFSFTNPLNGQKFEIEGPPAMNEAQARRIFEDQLNAGALVGLKPGDVLDSASQALDGVAGAAGQLAQQLKDVAGSASGALTGALGQATAGLQAAAGGALAGVTQNLQGAVGSLSQQATQFAGALPSAINQATSVASQAVSGITKSVTNLIPTNPINVADLAKQATALLPIQGLSGLDVRAAMSQATNLVGQASDKLSALGAGKFGFNAEQLEISGLIKPGIAKLVGAVNPVTNQVNSLQSVLSSPSAFTGKMGIANVNDLLASVPKQDMIQQQLMNQGLSAVNELGIPINKLDPGALAGTALNAAKSVTDTFKWATGGDIGSALKTQFDQAARAADFATSFAQSKINDAVAQTAEPGAALDTANRDTVDAAVTRVTGNAKIPPVKYSNVPDQGVIELANILVDLLTLSEEDWAEFYKTKVNPLLKGGYTPIRENRDSENPDVQKVIADLKMLEQLQADSLAYQARFLALKRRADALNEKINQYPPRWETLFTKEYDYLAKWLTWLEGGIAKFRTKVQSFTA